MIIMHNRSGERSKYLNAINIIKDSQPLMKASSRVAFTFDGLLIKIIPNEKVCHDGFYTKMEIKLLLALTIWNFWQSRPEPV